MKKASSIMRFEFITKFGKHAGGDDSTETFEHDIDDAGDAFNKNFDKRFDNHPFLNILQ